MSAVLALPTRNRYSCLYDRLVANTKLVGRCWEWTGHVTGHYPKITLRTDRGPRSFWAHRLMLEEVLRCYFPFDEAGHLCNNPTCINPDHLEVQTRAYNLAQRRGYASPKCEGKPWIPVLFPWDEVRELAWDEGGHLCAIDEAIPF